MQEMILPIKKETLVDVIHDQILEVIIRENVTEESVFTEGRLVQQFDVSKATVREALVRLCNESILRSIPRYGYVIAHFGEKEAQDILEFRQMIEPTALVKCFVKISKQQYASLEELLNRHNGEETKSVWDIWRKNIEFHCLLISFSDNHLYPDLLQRVMQQQALFFAQNRWKSERTFKDRLYAEAHNDILFAIRDNDQDRALESLRNDISWPF